MAFHLPATLIAIHLAASPGIPQHTVRAAQEQAAHILATAHVRIEWAERADLQLQITEIEPRGLTPDATGFAVLVSGDSGYATVSWPKVVRQAEQMEVNPVILLGAAMAHEIGHLLFGSGHSANGVMSPHLGPKEVALASRGELRFEEMPGRNVRLVSGKR
jgi:hypothetical protein